jgi:mono/diheme cytochrome c family protein
MVRAWLGATAMLGATVVVSGCHVDMWTQPKIRAYYPSEFFADGQGSRPLVPGTVPQGPLRSGDPAYFTGLVNGKPVKTIPLRAVQAFASPKDMLLRGQDRFNVYCSPCHSRTGDGNGFITQRGIGYWSKLPASYHTDRLRKIEDGHIYDVLTNGFGIMYGYGARIQDPNDRWAVVAYVRALQLARTASPSGAPAVAPAVTTGPVPAPAEPGAAGEPINAEPRGSALGSNPAPSPAAPPPGPAAAAPAPPAGGATR